MFKTSKQEYKSMSEALAPRSPALKDCTWAFFIGGAICTLGEALHTIYTALGFEKDNGALLVSASLIALSAVFTALGLYQKLAAKAGAGTLVPITGFANAVVSPAIEYRCEGFITGIGAKMFLIAGPVVVYGVLASSTYGVIYYFLTYWSANI